MADGVNVTGLREAVRGLEKLGVDVADLKDVMQRVGGVVRDEAATLAPRRSGKLADSIRASRTKGKAIIRAGGRAVPYAGVINYGWPAHNIEPAGFMEKALANRQQAALTTLADGLRDLIRQHNLGD